MKNIRTIEAAWGDALRIITSLQLILLIGIAVAGLTVTPAKAAQLIITSNGGSVSAQDMPDDADRTDFSGGATKSKALGGLSDDYGWGKYDILDQPLGGGFSLDYSDESTYRIQQIRNDGYNVSDQ